VAPDQIYRPKTVDEARAAVRELAGHHADIVKIWVDDNFGKFVKMQPDIYTAVIDECRGELKAANDDWFSFNVSTLAPIRLETSTPADGANQFVNTLNPHIELYDASNTLVATGSSLDGRNEAILYAPTTTGTYRVRVTTEGGTAGEYFLTRKTGLFWDPDGNPANNDITTGAGLGGAGPWDTTSAVWFNGVTDVAWFTNYASSGTITAPDRTFFGALVTGPNSTPSARYLMALGLVAVFALAADLPDLPWPRSSVRSISRIAGSDFLRAANPDYSGTVHVDETQRGGRLRRQSLLPDLPRARLGHHLAIAAHFVLGLRRLEENDIRALLLEVAAARHSGRRRLGARTRRGSSPG
jgi:hypothetical protein